MLFSLFSLRGQEEREREERYPEKGVRDVMKFEYSFPDVSPKTVSK